MTLGSTASDGAHVYVGRAARTTLTKLEPEQRARMIAAFLRVGQELLERGARIDVPLNWVRRTWPSRHYPQQCYPKTLKYIQDHPHITGMRLVHGVISHAPRFTPLDHAWVELPGGIVFDGVVQAFFTHESYTAVMSAVPLDTYSPAQSEQLLATFGHPGPWNAAWVPTPAQVQAYQDVIDPAPAHRSTEPALPRQRVLLHENNAALKVILCDLFADENLDVTSCGSFAQLQTCVMQYPLAVIVSNSWQRGGYQNLSPRHRAELVGLAQSAEVVLTTGSEWGRNIHQGELGTAQIVEKPYDLDWLLAAISAAFEQASRGKVPQVLGVLRSGADFVEVPELRLLPPRG